MLVTNNESSTYANYSGLLQTSLDNFFFFYIILIYKYLPIAPFRLFHDRWKIGNGFTGIVFYNEMFGFQGFCFRAGGESSQHQLSAQTPGLPSASLDLQVLEPGKQGLAGLIHRQPAL